MSIYLTNANRQLHKYFITANIFFLKKKNTILFSKVAQTYKKSFFYFEYANDAE